jgi:membrane-bound lytic murein transglycosylase D
MRGGAIIGRGNRDLRLAVFGCCSAVGGLCLLLAACAGNAPHVEQATPTPEIAPAPPATTAAVAAPESTTAPAPPAQSESPWPRLRASFELPGCDFNPSVQHWTHVYAQSPRDIVATLTDAMPYLLLVSDQLARNRLPGEFAFLPYLESNYTPIATSGDRAAGIWQLMPDTALEAGLRITPDYDGRLDISASTGAAISLLRQYHDEFGDWRLADMAFNAGLYKVRQLLTKYPRNADWPAHELAQLGVNPATHDHLAKLLALSCIVSNPERYHVRLPEPNASDRVVVLDLPAPVDLPLAARLAGIDMALLRKLNPGFVHGRMPAEGPFHLLVPASRRVAFERTLGKLPQYLWRSWHEVVLKQTETLDVFAMLSDIDPSALAVINDHASDVPLPPGTHLLLPGTAKDTDTAVAVAVPSPPPADQVAADAPESTTVHAGDTLWDIARRYGLHVEDLLRWNSLTRNTTLRLGQHLFLAEPDSSRRPAP